MRPDGYHELDAEMVTLDLADELELDDGGDGLDVEAGAGRAGRRPARPPATTSSTGPWRPCGRRAGVRLVKRIPLGGGLGGGSADAAAVLRWAGCTDLDVAAALGADVPFCLVGGRARVEGIGERVDAAPASRPAPSCCSLPPVRRGHGAGSTGAWDDRTPAGGPRGRTTSTAAALAVEPRLARVARRAWAS